MSLKQVSIRRSIYCVLLTVGAGLLISYFYRTLDQWTQRPWLAAALANTLVAALILVANDGKVPRITRLADTRLLRSKLLTFIDEKKWAAYLPAAAVALFSVGAVSISRIGEGAAPAVNIPIEHIAWVFWIPVVEELTFRVGFGNFFRKRYGIMLGAYLSAILFAFVHTLPSVDKIAAGAIGIPLGPFFLAMANEFIVVSTGRLKPAILLHMACNASVPIFLYFDPRWLKWLSALYS